MQCTAFSPALAPACGLRAHSRVGAQSQAPRSVMSRKRTRGAVLRVRATAEPEDRDASSSGGAQLGVTEAIKGSVDNFFQKYDVISAGMGSLVVTTVCVKNGQDPATALWITAASTVVALVLHELWFGDETSPRV